METTMKERVSSLLSGKKCAVLGFGISNRPLVGFLLDHGATVTVCDAKDAEVLDGAEDYGARGASFVTGKDYLSVLAKETFDLVFRSPGIRPDEKEIAAAVEKGAVLTSEMELFLDLTPATVIGVTGSDGKTTTTTLTSLFLKEAGKRTGKRVFLGGNIGSPLLPRLYEMKAGDYAVVELSSFQLMTMKRSADRAVVTNLSPNHLNWHVDMDEYVASKCNIFKSPECRRVVLNRENETSWALSETVGEGTTVVPFTSDAAREIDGVCRRDGAIGFLRDGEFTPVLLESEIRLPGVHNIENYEAAIAVTEGLVTKEEILAVARSFTGVRHRLEAVREKDGVIYYNSSIDSSPSRTVAALSALDRPPVVICGGRDKHVPFSPMADALCKTAVGIVLTGEAAGQIYDAILSSPFYASETVPILRVEDFDEAVRAASRMARRGEAVLLSPGCTSFDAFKNFEERGDRFRAVVMEL